MRANTETGVQVAIRSHVHADRRCTSDAEGQASGGNPLSRRVVIVPAARPKRKQIVRSNLRDLYKHWSVNRWIRERSEGRRRKTSASPERRTAGT